MLRSKGPPVTMADLIRLVIKSATDLGRVRR